jgi:hypothetical protein
MFPGLAASSSTSMHSSPSSPPPLVETSRSPKLAPIARYTGGYASVLCAVTFAAHVEESRGAGMGIDKTIKTGKIA